jgi:hypothetical protein
LYLIVEPPLHVWKGKLWILWLEVIVYNIRLGEKTWPDPAEADLRCHGEHTAKHRTDYSGRLLLQL